MKPKILNIHGFDSHGENSKKAWLEKEFPDYEIISPTLPPVPKRAEEILSATINENSKIEMILGSSLGGFYAWYFGQIYDTPSVLLNPALNAFYDLRPRLGNGVNPKTGQTYHFSDEDLNHLAKMFARVYPVDYPYFKIFLSNRDEVLSFHYLNDVYKNHITVADYGSHRFEKVELILEAVKNILQDKKNIFNF